MPIIEESKRGRRLNAALQVILGKAETYYVTETKNVSYRGVCLDSKEAFPIGTRLQLIFGEPPELPRLNLEGVVRWSQGGMGVGVEFTSMSVDEQHALLEFVNSHYPSGQA